MLFLKLRRYDLKRYDYIKIKMKTNIYVDFATSLLSFLYYLNILLRIKSKLNSIWRFSKIIQIFNNIKNSRFMILIKLSLIISNDFF